MRNTKTPPGLFLATQVELTKHNLRLLIFEDVLHYHPECRGLIPPRHNAPTAPVTPATAGVPSTSSSSPSTTTAAPAPTSQQPPRSGNSNNGRTTSRTTSSTPRVSISSSPTPPIGANASTNPLPGAPPPPRGDDEEGLDGVPAWPPAEAAGPSAGLEAGPSAGAAGWSGEGATDDGVVMAARGVAGGEGVDVNGSEVGVEPAPSSGLVPAV